MLYKSRVKALTQLHKRVLDEGVLAALSLPSFIEAYRCLIADLTKPDERVGRVAALSLPPPVLNPMWIPNASIHKSWIRALSKSLYKNKTTIRNLLYQPDVSLVESL